MLVVGPERQQVQRVKQQLAQQFDIQDLGKGQLLGMGITRDRASRALHLSRQQLVSKFNTEQARPAVVPKSSFILSVTSPQQSAQPLGSLWDQCWEYALTLWGRRFGARNSTHAARSRCSTTALCPLLASR